MSFLFVKWQRLTAYSCYAFQTPLIFQGDRPFPLWPVESGPGICGLDRDDFPGLGNRHFRWGFQLGDRGFALPGSDRVWSVWERKAGKIRRIRFRSQSWLALSCRMWTKLRQCRPSPPAQTLTLSPLGVGRTLSWITWCTGQVQRRS